jgi:hypothetical protein
MGWSLSPYHFSFLFFANPTARFFLRELHSVLGNKWEDDYASPRISLATYNGGHGFTVRPPGRISTAKSREPTSNATVQAMIGERSATADSKHAAYGEFRVSTNTSHGRI